MDFYLKLTTLRTVFMVLCFLFFVWVCYWAFAARNQQELAEAQMLPFED